MSHFIGVGNELHACTCPENIIMCQPRLLNNSTHSLYGQQAGPAAQGLQQHQQIAKASGAIQEKMRSFSTSKAFP